MILESCISLEQLYKNSTIFYMIKIVDTGYLPLIFTIGILLLVWNMLILIVLIKSFKGIIIEPFLGEISSNFFKIPIFKYYKVFRYFGLGYLEGIILGLIGIFMRNLECVFLFLTIYTLIPLTIKLYANIKFKRHILLLNKIKKLLGIKVKMNNMAYKIDNNIISMP